MKFTSIFKSALYSVMLVSSTSVLAQSTVSGLEYLGKGYDIFGKYADPSSVKERLLSIEDKDFISINKINVKDVEQVSGSSISELSKQYANKFSFGVNAFYFKGGLETEFSGSSSSTEKLYYSSITDISSQYQIKYDIEPKSEIALLRKMVTGRAKQRLNSPDVHPKTLFEIYGTHYLFNIVVGGSARYNTVTRISQNMNQESIKVALEAEYKIFSGKASRELTTTEKTLLSSTTKKLYAIGGHSEYLNNINDRSAYNKWVSGIASNSVLCGLTDPNSLRPIWELCDNPERSKQIENYYKNVYVKLFPMPFSEANFKRGVLNNAFIGQIFQGDLTNTSGKDYLTFNYKDGVNLHYGNNLEKTVNLISINTVIDGVQFSVDKEAKILGVDYYDNGRLSFAIGDVNGNIAVYRVVKDGNSYRAQLKDKGTSMFDYITLKTSKGRLGVLQKGSTKLLGVDYGNQQADPILYDMANDLAAVGGRYISSIAKIGDVNGDGIEDFYCVSQNGHFLMSFNGTRFTVIKRFIKGEVVGSAFQVGASNAIIPVGNLNNDNKPDAVITDGNQYTFLYPGNQTVTMAVNYNASTTFANLRLASNSQIIGYVDLDHDGVDEVVFATDLGTSRKYQFIDVLSKKEKVSRVLGFAN